MTQHHHWPPPSLINGSGNDGGATASRHHHHHHQMSSASAAGSRSTAISSNHGIGGHGVASSSTSAKGDDRAAPQCSSSRAIHGRSPTSVVVAAAVGAPSRYDHRRGAPPPYRVASAVSGPATNGYHHHHHRHSYGGYQTAMSSTTHHHHHHHHHHSQPPPSSSTVVVASVPEANKKYKTEMCRNVLEHGYCRFGENCHYAHSEEERHAPSAEDLMRDDRLTLPCSIMVSTGFCPYDHRCKSLHDPRVAAHPSPGDGVIVLEHCTKAKRSGDAIPDRLYHRYLNSIRQINPIVTPYVWDARSRSSSADSDADDHDELEFRDTYNLVCNAGPGVSVFPRKSPAAAAASSSSMSMRKRRTGGGGGGSASLYSDVVGKNNNKVGAQAARSGVALGELQRLCIVLRIRASGNGAHLDFVYAPKDCLNGQPCMVLQTRYFRLIDISSLLRHQPVASISDIVAEVSPEVYRAGKKCGSSGGCFVSAHEVAFDSKGKRSCNLSIWFDATVTACSSSKAKKMSKKEDPWRLDDDAVAPGVGSSLFCMPNNGEFESSFPSSCPPYVFMQPVDDSKEGHDLIASILEHRVATVLRSRGFRSQEQLHRLDQLAKEFARMKVDLARWAWPKTSGTEHFSKTKEEQNRTPYIPATGEPGNKGSASVIASAIWESFVTNIDDRGEEPPKKRLPVFSNILKNSHRRASYDDLPRISLQGRRSISSPYRHRPEPETLSESTWRELLLGEGDGSWIRTMEAHLDNQRKSVVRSTPGSPPLMGQSTFCR